MAREACLNRADGRLMTYYKHRHGEHYTMRYLTDVEKNLCELVRRILPQVYNAVASPGSISDSGVVVKFKYLVYIWVKPLR